MSIMNRWEVWSLICRLGTHPHPGLMHSTDRKMIELYTQGFGVDAIGRKLGCTGSTVLYHLKKHSVRIRGRNETREKYKKLDLDDAIRMYEAGFSTIAIGKKYGLTNATVGRRLKAAGVTMRKRGQNDRHKAKC